jgi:CheY-like chemotaxis protein/anti-sigma regulatory factor (Ser/Thr protein kinase)
VRDLARVPPPRVAASESRLGQVILNLLVNAAQAIPEGDRDGNEIRVTTGVDARGRVTVAVSDTGAGMSPEVQRHLFTPFFTTKDVGVGTGMGLAICHRIVTSLGGEITFESAVGRGTRFVVALPAAPERASLPPRASRPAGPVTGGRPSARVLVIDDERLMVSSICRVLGGRHEVTGLERAGDALDLLREGRCFDVILCDLMMPQMTGMDFYAGARGLGRGDEGRVVFMTGGTFTERARCFLDAVPNPVLEKPFDPAALLSLVDAAVTAASPP